MGKMKQIERDRAVEEIDDVIARDLDTVPIDSINTSLWSRSGVIRWIDNDPTRDDQICVSLLVDRFCFFFLSLFLLFLPGTNDLP